MKSNEIDQMTVNILAGAGGGMLRYLRRFLMSPKRHWPTFLTSVFTGVVCAVFLTPAVAHFGGWSTKPELTTGLAFALGVMGMEAVELMLMRVRKSLDTEDK